MPMLNVYGKYATGSISFQLKPYWKSTPTKYLAEFVWGVGIYTFKIMNSFATSYFGLGKQDPRGPI